MPSNSFIRFCVVGIINTLIDVPLFVALHSAGLSVLAANIISTSLALLASLLLNYKFTFKSQRLSAASIGIYFAVTLCGIWVLQPLVISALLGLNERLNVLAPLIAITGHATQVSSLLAKLASLGVSLVWNYLWYSRVVFREAAASTDSSEA